MSRHKNLMASWGNPKHVLAPMVDGSELAWRMFGRNHGVHLTYTPMIHSVMFLKDRKYRQSCLQFTKDDRPLIAQFCANAPETFTEAAKAVEPYCDAIDLNLGCPQGIAKRGHYGAFLQDEWELLSKIIRHASNNLTLPITCKIRVFPDVERTVQYARMLEGAGVSLLTVHGRTREMKGHLTGLADWSQIRRVKEAVSIPVIANGNIQYFDDVERCLSETNADAVMSAEGHLHNPAIFSGLQPSVYDMCSEYLCLAEKYPTTLSIVRGHVFKILHHALNEHPEFRQTIGLSQYLKEIRLYIDRMRVVCADCKKNTSDELPHPHWICQPYERPKMIYSDAVANVVSDAKDESLIRYALSEQRKLRRETKRNLKQVRRDQSTLGRSSCIHCNLNLKGNQCPVNACRGCCWKLDPGRSNHCSVHQYAKKRRKDRLSPSSDVKHLSESE
ncbi:tRNA-dihydrouridine(16/17) synthase [Fasciola gigantica]|uniref:tRNA-dihydrouridine(16/17) synthase [NAD(P)(+)] n=1 Tax=Fasciola gigantica TaxID=46835 RepID=A0A504YHF1_FASGI|nr:tRNA-dihydrouridine(16/17) synthase [Fasciola gigantica]